MADKNTVLVNFNINRDSLNDVKKKYKEEMNNLKANPNISDDMKKELDKVWKVINANSVKLEKALQRITDVELSTTKFDKYREQIDAITDKLLKDFTALADKMETIDSGFDNSALIRNAKQATDVIHTETEAVNQLLTATSKLGTKVILTSSTDIANVKAVNEALKEAISLNKEYRENEPEYTDLDDDKVTANLKEKHKQFETIFDDAKKVAKALKNMNPDTDEYKVATAQLQAYILQLKNLQMELEGLDLEYDFRDNLLFPKDVNKGFWRTDEVKKFIKNIGDNSNTAQVQVEELYESLVRTAQVVKKEDLADASGKTGKGALGITAKIVTSSDTLYRDLVNKLNQIQDKLNKRGAILVPVKIVVEGTPYSESKKGDIAESIAKESKQSVNEVVGDVDSITSRTLDTIFLKIRKGFQEVHQFIRGDLEDTFKTTKFEIQAEIGEESQKHIQEQLQADNFQEAIDISESIDKAKGKFKDFSKEAKQLVDTINSTKIGDTNQLLGEIKEILSGLKGVSDLIDNINHGDIKLGTELNTIRLDVTDLKEVFESLSKSIQEVFTEIQKPVSLDSQWFKIGTTFQELTKDSKNLDLRKQKKEVEEFLKLYEQYVSLGGTNTLDALTNNSTVLNKLQSRTSVSVSSNKQLEEANNRLLELSSTFERIKVQLNDVHSSILKIQLEQAQLKTFNDLADILQKLETGFKNIGLGEGLQGIGTKKLGSLANFLERINKLKNVASVFQGLKIKQSYIDSLSQLPALLRKIHDELEQIETLPYSNFLQQLTSITNNAEALNNLAKILVNSKKELNNAIKQENKKKKESDINTQEFNNQLKILKKYEKEYEKFIKGNYPSDVVASFEEMKKIIDSIKTQNFEVIDESAVLKVKEANNALEEIAINAKKIGELAKQTAITNTIDKISKYAKQNSKLTHSYLRQLDDLIERLRQPELTKNQLNQIAIEFNEIKIAAREAGLEGTSFFEAFKTKLKYSWAQAFAYLFSFYDIIRYIREVTSAVTELNTNLIELSKVSDTAISDLYKQFNDFSKIAMDTGNSISDVIKATADWARMGYSLPDAKKLSEVAQIYKNVGDNISIDEANEYLISTLQGFQMSADDALHIVDIYNEVANNFAIDTQGIGEALERSAASFSAANTSLEEAVALVTTANSVLQNPEMVGTTFKTLSARLRGATTELETLGEESTVTTSKLRETVKALTGFDILEKDNQTYKSIYEILIGIGKEWENLTDIERASLGEMLAGKRNSNALFAVLQNIETLESAYETAQQSAGSAMAEQERYMKGIEYSVKQFKVALEDISNDILDSEFAKGVVDFGTKVLSVLDKIFEHPTIALLLTGGIGTHFLMRKLSSDGNGGFYGLYGAIHDVTEAYKKYIATVYASSEAEAIQTATARRNIEVTNENTLANQAEAYSEMQQAQAERAHTAATTEGIIAGELEQAQDIANARANVAEATTELSQKLSNSFKNLIAVPGKIIKGLVNLAKTIPALGIGAAILGIASIAKKVISDIEKGEEQLKDSAKELSSQYSETKNNISAYQKEIAELRNTITNTNSSYEESSNARERLLTIQDELIEKYGYERDAIDNITSAIEGQIGALDELSEREWRKKKSEFNEENLSGIDWITQKVHGASDNIGVMLDEMEDAFVRIQFNVGYTNEDVKFLELVKDFSDGTVIDVHGNNPFGIDNAYFEGSLNEIYDKLLLIQKTAKDIGVSSEVSDYISSILQGIEDTKDSYDEFYSQYVFNERILGGDYESLYRGYSKAYRDYQKVLVDGTEEDAESALQEMSNQYQTLVKNLADDTTLGDEEKQSILEWFESLYPALAALIAQWKFTANIDLNAKIGNTDKTQEEIIKEVTDAFKTPEDLNHYNEKIATDEQKQAYKDMNALLVERNATQEDFINYLIKANYYQQQINENKPEPFEIKYNISEIEAASKGIKSLQSTYQSLYDAMEEGKEGIDLAFSYEDLDSLKDNLKDAQGNVVDLGNTWTNFYNIMSDGNHTFEEMRDALNEVLTAYVNATIDLHNFDSAQAKALSTQLQLAGVTKESADMYVQAYVDRAEAVQYATKMGYEFIDQIDSEDVAFINEAEAAGYSKEQLALYALEKQIANGLVISTAADCENLIQLASIAGATNEQLAKLIELKARLANVQAMIDAHPDTAAATALVNEANKIREEIEDYLVEDVVADAKARAANFKFSDKKSNSSKSGGGGGSKSEKEEDLWKKAYEEELKALDHLHEMELISDIQYYEERERLNDKYFKDNEKYADEYNKNLEEIYKGFQSAYKQYVDDMSDYWKKSLESNLIDFKSYCSQMETMLNSLHDAGKIDDETYFTKLGDYYGSIIENYDKAINAAQRTIKKRIDALNDEKEALEKDYQNRKDLIQSQIDGINEQINATQKEIDKLEEANKQRQAALDMQKALYELNRAENQRPDYVYNSEKGFVYQNRDTDIKAAQEELDNLRYEQQISILERTITTLNEQIDSLNEQIDGLDEELDRLTDAIDSQIDKLQEYSDKWGEVRDKYQEAQEDIIATAIWGSDWQNEILSMNESILVDFTNNYTDMQQKQVEAAVNAANAKIAAYNAEIRALNDLKEAQKSAEKTATSSAVASSTNVSSGKAKKKITPTETPSKITVPSTAQTRSVYVYGSGTDNASPGFHEIAESGDEIVLDNYGNAYLAKGRQLHRFEGGEKVYNENETRELLRGKYLPIDSLFPNYSDMLSKMSNMQMSFSGIGNSVVSKKPSLGGNTEITNSFTVTIGDINVSEVNDASALAKAITNKLPNALLQELNRK